jgi:hypothetical protein
MNNIRNDFPPDLKKFFYDLKNYLDTDLFFYGSVNRPDYVHDKSDIDIGIFTDNEHSMMTKIQHFLHVKKDAFDKVVWKLEGKIIYGYKIKCDKYINSKCEIAIYNSDFKNILLNEMKTYNTLPFYILIMLFFLKTVFYIFPIISSDTYKLYKRIIFNRIMINKQNSNFVLLKQNKV